MQADVLIIEDEIHLAELIRMYLADEGIETEIAGTAEEGLKKLDGRDFDLIVLDINLPGMDGFEFLQSFRRTSRTPVIIVSARESDEDIVMGLGIGADEFVTKPFVPKVLATRIRAILRRTKTWAQRRQVVKFGGFEIDLEGYSLQRDGKRISLSTKEFEVLRCLIRHAGKALSPYEIYEEVWGNLYGDITTVGVYVMRIRRKLGDDPQNPALIRTIHGKGYMFNPDIIT